VLIPLHMLQQRIQWTLQAAIDKVPIKQRAKAVRVIVSVLQKIGDHHIKRNSTHYIITATTTTTATTMTTTMTTTTMTTTMTTTSTMTSTAPTTTSTITGELTTPTDIPTQNQLVDDPLVLLGEEHRVLFLYFSFFQAVFKKAGMLITSDGVNNTSNTISSNTGNSSNNSNNNTGNTDNNSNSNIANSNVEFQGKMTLTFSVKYPHHIYIQLAEQLNEFTDETMLKHFGCDIWT